jgi:signal transduction histidine kinase
MTRRLVLSYLAIALLVLAILEIPLGVVFARSERRNLVAELKHDALALGAIAEETLAGHQARDLQKVVESYQERTDGRVVITNRSGRLVADSEGNPDARNYSTRPEIADALNGRESVGHRYSDTLGSDLTYVSVPISSGGTAIGAVRITYTPTEVNARVRRIWLMLGLIGLVILSTTALVSTVIARSITRPLRKLEHAASRLAAGDLSERTQVASGPPEVQALASTFDTMAARLEQLVGAQEAFVADASHQLRTPLQALRLRLENVEADAPRALKPELEAALNEVGRLGSLVEGLLALARAEKEAPAAERIDVADVLDERREAWEAFADEAGVTLGTPMADGVATTTPGYLETILDNLISNAVDASSDGSAIDLRTERLDGWIEVHVTDHGHGMTPEQRARATDRFWRADDATGDGSGLGLAIAHRLVALDGGELELRATPGGGLDAVVKLRPAGRSGA